MSPLLLILLPLLALGGLVFILFVGKRRRNSSGKSVTPSPGSPDAPIFGKPER